MPHPFLAVGESYWDISQVSDEEVRELLANPTTTGTPTIAVESPADAVRRVAQ
jgi:predicted phosphoribosyltransferase